MGKMAMCTSQNPRYSTTRTIFVLKSNDANGQQLVKDLCQFVSAWATKLINASHHCISLSHIKTALSR